MYLVLDCLVTAHDWRLVALAGTVCFLASWASVSLFQRASERNGRARLIWVLIAGSATGCGIWATHFIAMLAYQPGFVVGYQVTLTALSLVAAILVTSIGLAVSVLVPSRWAVWIGGSVVGLGIGAMHYTGILAIEMPAHILWRFELVATSVVFGMAFSAIALAITVRFGGWSGLCGGAALLTLAIVSHHFTGMGAVGIIPDPLRDVDPLALSPTIIAIAIAGLTVVIAGMSFVGTLVDRRFATAADQFKARIRQLSHTQAALLQDADAKLREHHLRLDTALNNMSQGLCMFDSQARLVICNQRYLQMYGLDGDAIHPGVSVRDLLERRTEIGSYQGDPNEYIAQVLASVKRGQTSSVRSELADGRVVVVVNQPMAGGGWVATHEDITSSARPRSELPILLITTC